MSNYPVKIKDWFLPGDTEYSILQDLIKSKELLCDICKKRVTINKGWIDHGYFSMGYGKVYCSKKCSRE